MRTLLSQFCEEFEGVVRPLVAPLKRSADALAAARSDLPGRELRPQLAELAHHVGVLADKVAEQQAYVLIFGPLKSGKSTLMNALSAAYVSEVTSLPAYPCMVYVSHGPKKQFTVTDYDGASQSFADPVSLHLHVGRAHGELAERIRAAEEAGSAFDPAVHYTDAIRRIDVRLPAEELQQSSAVLVDTPGLYSRMKFGYDRMTRDFRNVAACAIFVVKSDNLFLEQVFQEFTELLDLFNRVFLVVNLDTTKRDLGPDGKLVPSLEKEDPLRIIEAFENLAMSAALKAAADEGRLKIYPVDLLRAASGRLLSAPGIRGIDATETADDADDYRGQSNFDSFLGDLTDYLNSTDYLVTFLGDSLRRARSLLGETADLCTHPALDALRKKTAELERERAEVRERQEAIERLVGHAFEDSFRDLQATLGEESAEKAKPVAERTSRALDGALGAWFTSDASLDDLIRGDVLPLLASHQTELSRLVAALLQARVRAGDAGLRLPRELSQALSVAWIDLNGIARASLEGLEPDALVTRPRQPLDAERIPVRKSLWDWLLLRRQANVRRRLFGPEGRPSVRIAPEAKASRLGEPAKEAMRRELDLFLGGYFAESLERMTRAILGDYSRTTLEGLSHALNEARTSNGERLAGLETRLGEHRASLARIEELGQSSHLALDSLEDLSARYLQTDPDLLIQPLPAERLPTPPAAGDVGPRESGVGVPERRAAE